MGYVPVRTQVGNQLYMVAAILAHNLTRELQMRISPRERHHTTAKRAALWCFREIEALRRTTHSTSRAHHSPRRQADSVNEQ